MPKTVFNVSADLVANAPETSSSEDPGKQTNNTTDAGNTDGKTEQKDSTNKNVNTGNTGLFTTVSKDGAIVDHTMPIVFGSIFFIGIIILCATIVKLRRRRVNSNYSLKKRQTSRILGVFSGLMMLAGLGGLAGGFLNSSAINVPVEDISTSTVVKAELVDHTDTYKLYCGVDTITFNKATRNGWILRAYGENDATLTSKDAKNTNIASIDDWKELPVGSWGFKTDRELYEELTDKNQYKPINLGNGVIAQSIFASEAGDTVDVTYCAKVDAKTVGDFTATINYEAVLKGTNSSASDIPLMNGLFNYVDYDSPDDEDGDEMSNREENRLGLDPMATDTDNDGLFDNEELEIYGTDPFNADTDGDSLLDYTEIALDEPLDPLNAKTDGETLDGQRETTYTYEDEYDGIKVEITGTGNTPIFSADIYDEEAEAANEAAFAAAEETGEDYVETPANILTSDINLYTEGNLTSATIEIAYTDEQLTASGLTEDTMSVYYVNDEEETDDTYEKRESILDTENNTITTTVNHFSHYFVASDDTPEEDYPVNPGEGIITPEPIPEEPLNGAAAPGGAHTFSSTKGQKTKYNNDNKKDKVLADSTFRSQYHGFKFANISTDMSEGGNCGGMARLADLRFRKKLPTKRVSGKSILEHMTLGLRAAADLAIAPIAVAQSAGMSEEEIKATFFTDKKTGEFNEDAWAVYQMMMNGKSYDFNLSNTEYTNYNKDLNSITIKTDVLKYSVNFKWSDLGQTKNRTFTDSEAFAANLNAYMIDDESSTNTRAWENTTKAYANGENPLLYPSKVSTIDNRNTAKYRTSISGMNSNTASINRDDKEILNAINYYQYNQFRDLRYYSSSVITKVKESGVKEFIKDKLKINFRAAGGKVFIKTLAKYLNNKEAVNLAVYVNDDMGTPNDSTDDLVGNHEINATRIIQDGSNANKYYVEVYDNNYPGETMVMTLSCNLSRCTIEKYENTDKNGTKPYRLDPYELLTIDFEEGRVIVPAI